MSLSPAQKRRKNFKCRQDWIDWALRVVRSHGGVVQVNEYRWTRGADLVRACYWAMKQGLLRRSGPPSRRRFEIVEKTEDAARPQEVK